jgi:hypothetical protein
MAGHLYECPNGHLFVIGECGGAMQVRSPWHAGPADSSTEWGVTGKDHLLSAAAADTVSLSHCPHLSLSGFVSRIHSWV